MSMMSEFKEFALKGNVMDLAVGVIIGAAFGKIVTSLVDDVIMPVVGWLFGGLDFADYYHPLSEVPAGLHHLPDGAHHEQAQAPGSGGTSGTGRPRRAHRVVARDSGRGPEVGAGRERVALGRGPAHITAR